MLNLSLILFAFLALAGSYCFGAPLDLHSMRFGKRNLPNDLTDDVDQLNWGGGKYSVNPFLWDADHHYDAGALKQSSAKRRSIVSIGRIGKRVVSLGRIGKRNILLGHRVPLYTEDGEIVPVIVPVYKDEVYGSFPELWGSQSSIENSFPTSDDVLIKRTGSIPVVRTGKRSLPPNVRGGKRGANGMNLLRMGKRFFHWYSTHPYFDSEEKRGGQRPKILRIGK